MKPLLLVFVIFVTCIMLMDLNRVEGVIDGRWAMAGEFPYMVAILKGNELRCGGALISNIHVLTARNCVVQWDGEETLEKNIHVTADALNPYNGSETIGACGIFIYENIIYIPWMISEFDIAVIRLKRAFQSPNVKKIDLPEQYEKYELNTPFIMTGYGAIDRRQRGVYELQKKEIHSRMNSFCKKFRNLTVFTLKNLCATAGIGDMHDVGSPLVTKDGRKIAGIASMGPAYPKPDSSDIYTKVSHHIDFIKKMMNQTRATCSIQ